MSTLIKEDDEFLYLEEYVHNNDDELPDWAINEYSTHDWDFYNYSDKIVEAAVSATSELLVSFRIRKSDAEIFIDSVR